MNKFICILECSLSVFMITITSISCGGSDGDYLQDCSSVVQGVELCEYYLCLDRECETISPQIMKQEIRIGSTVFEVDTSNRMIEKLFRYGDDLYLVSLTNFCYSIERICATGNIEVVGGIPCASTEAIRNVEDLVVSNDVVTITYQGYSLIEPQSSFARQVRFKKLNLYECQSVFAMSH